MGDDRTHRDGGGRASRRVIARLLIVIITVAFVLLLGAVAMILIPILTHTSAGSSGQQVPDTVVSSTSAEGADGRTRTLEVLAPGGGPADLTSLRPGDELIVRGEGFDHEIGIYVSICTVPDQPGEKPSPCLGGIPEGAMEEDAESDDEVADPESSVWITDDWAWRSFATQGYDDDERGSFTARLLVAEPVQEGLNCETTRCAITTRADHTAAGDRVQDVQLPVIFAGGGEVTP